MTFKDGLDRSNEETKSSWSSSEEALAACEGLIFNEPLYGGTKCRYHITQFLKSNSSTLWVFLNVVQQMR